MKPVAFIKLRDNGGRRSGYFRRQFSYSMHIPEKRWRAERRSGHDRRKKPRYSRIFQEGTSALLARSHSHTD